MWGWCVIGFGLPIFVVVAKVGCFLRRLVFACGLVRLPLVWCLGNWIDLVWSVDPFDCGYARILDGSLYLVFG